MDGSPASVSSAVMISAMPALSSAPRSVSPPVTMSVLPRRASRPGYCPGVSTSPFLQRDGAALVGQQHGGNARGGHDVHRVHVGDEADGGLPFAVGGQGGVDVAVLVHVGVRQAEAEAPPPAPGPAPAVFSCWGRPGWRRRRRCRIEHSAAGVHRRAYKDFLPKFAHKFARAGRQKQRPGRRAVGRPGAALSGRRAAASRVWAGR